MWVTIQPFSSDMSDIHMSFSGGGGGGAQFFKRNHIKQYCGNVISSTLQGLEKPSWPKVFRGVLPWEMLDGEDLDQVILNDMFLSCVFFVMPKNGLFKVLVSF